MFLFTLAEHEAALQLLGMNVRLQRNDLSSKPYDLTILVPEFSCLNDFLPLTIFDDMFSCGMFGRVYLRLRRENYGLRI